MDNFDNNKQKSSFETAKANVLANKSVQKKIKGVQKTNKKIKIGKQIENSIELQKNQGKNFESAQIQIPSSLRKTITNEEAQKYIKKENAKIYRKTKREKERELRKKQIKVKNNILEQSLTEISNKYNFEITFSRNFTHKDLKVGSKIITRFGESIICELLCSATKKEWISVKYLDGIKKKYLLKNLDLFIV